MCKKLIEKFPTVWEKMSENGRGRDFLTHTAESSMYVAVLTVTDRQDKQDAGSRCRYKAKTGYSEDYKMHQEKQPENT